MIDPQSVVTAILALGTGLGALVYGLQKYQVTNSKKHTTIASEGAQAAQFTLLHDAIQSNKLELTELRAEFLIMDRTIHRQQRTMTRMEMLLRQFSSLVSNQGIPVPKYMQSELDELIIDSDSLYTKE